MVMSMNLNPEFQKSMRGYKVEEVDEFVSQISTAYEQVRRDLLKSREENEKLKQQVDYFQTLENSLNKALISAQQKADEIINSAQDEVSHSLVESRARLENINAEITKILGDATDKARLIEEEAHNKAEEILKFAVQKAEDEVTSHLAGVSRMKDMKDNLLHTLKAFIEELEGVPEVVAVVESLRFGQVDEAAAALEDKPKVNGPDQEERV